MKLNSMGPAKFYRKLKHQKEVLHLLRSKGRPKLGSLLKQKIPCTAYRLGYFLAGYIEIDLVVHRVSSAFGEYMNFLSTTV